MYMSDPREYNPVVNTGETLESGIRTSLDNNGEAVKEPLYKWNGLVLDLCGMDPQDKEEGYMAPPTYKQA